MRVLRLGLGIFFASLVAATLGFVVGTHINSAASDLPPAPERSRSSVLDVETSILATVEVSLPDREDCEAIRGSEYRSDGERDWYMAKCLPPPAPPVPAPNPPALPGAEVPGERWVLISIANQEATAMIGNQALYTALVTTGKPGWETPRGNFRINYRVANETMTSESIGAEEYYVLKDVLYTQYFASGGYALHLNYWRPDYYFGEIPSSHGCVGMRLADAEFFWHFATNGTRITIE